MKRRITWLKKAFKSNSLIVSKTAFWEKGCNLYHVREHLDNHSAWNFYYLREPFGSGLFSTPDAFYTITFVLTFPYWQPFSRLQRPLNCVQTAKKIAPSTTAIEQVETVQNYSSSYSHYFCSVNINFCYEPGPSILSLTYFDFATYATMSIFKTQKSFYYFPKTWCCFIPLSSITPGHFSTVAPGLCYQGCRHREVARNGKHKTFSLKRFVQ